MFYINSMLEPLMLLCSAWVIGVIIWVCRQERKNREKRLKLGTQFSCRDFNEKIWADIRKAKHSSK